LSLPCTVQEARFICTSASARLLPTSKSRNIASKASIHSVNCANAPVSPPSAASAATMPAPASVSPLQPRFPFTHPDPCVSLVLLGLTVRGDHERRRQGHRISE